MGSIFDNPEGILAGGRWKFYRDGPLCGTVPVCLPLRWPAAEPADIPFSQPAGSWISIGTVRAFIRNSDGVIPSLSRNCRIKYVSYR